VPAFFIQLHDRLCGYSHGVHFNEEGDAWVDPPDYWEKIVLPAYLDAHREIFEDGDVENGGLTNKVKGLVLIEPERENKEMSMTDIVERCCQELYQFVVPEGSNK
jgi:nicotinamide/nicotinate riboside kinase